MLAVEASVPTEPEGVAEDVAEGGMVGVAAVFAVACELTEARAEVEAPARDPVGETEGLLTVGRDVLDGAPVTLAEPLSDSVGVPEPVMEGDALPLPEADTVLLPEALRQAEAVALPEKGAVRVALAEKVAMVTVGALEAELERVAQEAVAAAVREVVPVAAPVRERLGLGEALPEAQDDTDCEEEGVAVLVSAELTDALPVAEKEGGGLRVALALARAVPVVSDEVVAQPEALGLAVRQREGVLVVLMDREGESLAEPVNQEAVAEVEAVAQAVAQAEAVGVEGREPVAQLQGVAVCDMDPDAWPVARWLAEVVGVAQAEGGALGVRAAEAEKEAEEVLLMLSMVAVTGTVRVPCSALVTVAGGLTVALALNVTVAEPVRGAEKVLQAEAEKVEVGGMEAVMDAEPEPVPVKGRVRVGTGLAVALEEKLEDTVAEAVREGTGVAVLGTDPLLLAEPLSEPGAMEALTLALPVAAALLVGVGVSVSDRVRVGEGVVEAERSTPVGEGEGDTMVGLLLGERDTAGEPVRAMVRLTELEALTLGLTLGLAEMEGLVVGV